MKDLFEEDPFLCPECAKVGYCIDPLKKRSSVIEEEDKAISEELIDTESEIMEEELVEQE